MKNSACPPPTHTTCHHPARPKPSVLLSTHQTPNPKPPKLESCTMNWRTLHPCLFYLTCLAFAIGQPNSFQQCAADFVENCTTAADPGNCKTCMEHTPPGDCTPSQIVVFYQVCNSAPFTSATEDCMRTVVGDCSAHFDTHSDCRACVLSHISDEKSGNCTNADIAAVTGICTQIPNASPSAIVSFQSV